MGDPGNVPSGGYGERKQGDGNASSRGRESSWVRMRGRGDYLRVGRSLGRYECSGIGVDGSRKLLSRRGRGS